MKTLRESLVEATAHAGAGRIDAAIAAYREAIALAPARGDLRHNLGALLFDQGELDAAARVFTDAHALHPDWPALPLRRR